MAFFEVIFGAVVFLIAATLIANGGADRRHQRNMRDLRRHYE